MKHASNRLGAWKLLAAAGALIGLSETAVVAADAAMEPAKFARISGRIASVDRLRRTLSVDQRMLGILPAGRREFILNAQTDIADADRNPVTLGALQPGDRVKVHYANERDQDIAHEVIVHKSLPRASAPEAAPASAPETAPFQQPAAQAPSSAAPSGGTSQ